MALQLNRIQKRLPFGGHHFTDRDVLFKGETFEEVVKKVSQFRLSNHLPIGNPEQEILVHYARNWPWMVKEAEHKEETPDSQNYLKWRDWIYRTLRNPPTNLITKKEAAERWDKCQGCPHNLRKDWSVSSESMELDRKAFMLRRGLDVPWQLGFCGLHLAELPVFTFIQQAKEFSSKKDGEEYKDCWVS